MVDIRVACCQVELAIGDPEGNRESVREAVREAAGCGADVVVVPELANSGYAFRDIGEATALGEALEGPTVTGWLELAYEYDLVVVGGFCERGASGLYNTAVIADSTGLRAVYRKAHLWDREKLVFTPGNECPKGVNTTKGRLGMLICYDLEFPEWVRVSGLDGVELLCVPTNWPHELCVAGERAIEVVRVQGAASVNRMFIAVCDRTGFERGTDWVGGSVIVGPDGWPLAGPACEPSGPISAICSLQEAQDKKISAHNDVHGDRRPELYSRLIHSESDVARL